MNSPQIFRLVLFGSPSLAGPDGVPLSGRASQRHRLALLALLALAPGGRMSREKLVAYLWPESDAERGRNLLNVSLYVLRSVLGEGALVSAGEDLRLDGSRVRSDVAEFTAALERGDEAAAAGLYRGPFLDGFFVPDAPELEQWTERERARLAGAHQRALEALAVAAAEAGDAAGAASWWRARAATDPYDSRVAVQLMIALEASGNAAGALQHAAVHRRLLQEEFGIESVPQVAALAERLRTAAAAPPSDSHPPPASHAPSQPASAPPAPPPPAEAEARVAPAVVAEPVAGSGTGLRLATLPGWSARAAAAAVLVSLLLVVGSASGLLTPANRAQAPRERSIVVLPFVNLAPTAEGDYFTDGLTEEVITRLAAVPEIKVISRTSAMHYKGSRATLRQITEELNVAHALEGSVRRAGGRIRVAVQLIDARTDEHRWAKTYEYEYRDALRLQEEIAQEVARALEPRITPPVRTQLARRGTRDPEAYDLYRRGRFHWRTRTEEGHRRALDYFRRAIARDSMYAEPYAGIADVYMTGFYLGLLGVTEKEANSRVKWAAERALALDEQSSDAHVAFAVSLWCNRNWPGAERELRRAIELNPGHAGARGWYALLAAGMGRMEESVREARAAAELDPFSVTTGSDYAWVCYLSRDYDCAIRQARRTLEVDESWQPAYSVLGLAYAGKGMHAAAIGELSAAAKRWPRNPWLHANLARVLAAAGQESRARALLRRMPPGAQSPLEIASAHAALGQTDSAFAWLERNDWRWPQHGVRAHPDLDPLRADPRFARLSAGIEREMGLR